jgi:hypothetical protein
MGLIQCPDCKKEISDQATACIYCGRPLTVIQPEVQTVELTSKRYKGQQLLGILGICIGFFIVLVSSGHAPGSLIGSLMLIGGLILWISGRVGAWWNHS